MNDYKKLNKAMSYDKDVVEELALAIQERNTLTARLEYLDELIKDNSELNNFIWVTNEGDVLPIHKIEDSHLSNILGLLSRAGRTISKELRAEAQKRNIPIPTTRKLLSQVIDVDDDFDMEW